IVSHDRAFLERTVTRVLEIDEIAHTAVEYGGGWAGYLELRATAARHAEERFEAFTTERDRLTDRARTQRQWSETGVRKAKASKNDEPDKNIRHHKAERSEKQAAKVRATERAIERLDAVDKPWRRWELQLRFGGGERSGDVTVRLDGAVMRRGSFTLGPLDLELAWGERVALVGPNGSGKTTLVDALLGRLELASGTRWIGPGVRAGTLDQARAGFTGGALLDAFVEQSGLTVPEARSLLAKFGLESDAVGRAASSLSPGERTRASLALLMASGANFLILDEPTNHLDLPAIEQLETALNAYDGTLLLVTHDRQLLDAVSIDRTIELSGAKV
ncbi:MAG TPA: ATP-binding cassette domain-containing protein, partial [Solirubrobacteraceae bacterium]|nr:ATP-binding cassette domain-containing protein [Solirubrobacteraceae bacterium]